VESGWVDRHETERLIVHDWSEHCDDAVNMSLARGKLCFSDGKRPKLTRLGPREKAEAESFYGKSAKLPPQQSIESPLCAHGVHTESAEKHTAIALAIASITSLSTAREAVKLIHEDCRRLPDMAIENSLRAWPKDRWAEAIEAMGRHYAGDAPMKRPPLAILENYLARGPRAKAAAAGPVKQGRDWKFKTDETKDQMEVQ
jgi:hypothetical protein